MKSGSDFRQLGKLTLTFNCSKVDIDIEEITVDSRFEEDHEMKEIVGNYLGKMKKLKISCMLNFASQHFMTECLTHSIACAFILSQKISDFHSVLITEYLTVLS